MDDGVALMRLSGWALAQGMWQVAGGEPLATFAAWDTESGRGGARVDADSIPASVEAARRNLAAIEGLRRWVIVAEGVARADGGARYGAIRAEFGATDAALVGHATWLFQRVEGRFDLVHGPVLVVAGVDPATLAVLRLALLDAMHAVRAADAT